MDYEDFRRQYGGFGWYNMLLLLIIGLTGVTFYASNNYAINLLGMQTNHWCKNQQHLNGHHIRTNETNKWNTPTQSASCTMLSNSTYNLHNVKVNETAIHARLVDCPNGWLYDTSIRSSTYKMEWNIVCADAWMADLVTPVYIFGQFVGSVLCGAISNKLGRRRALILCAGLMSVSGLVAAFSTHIFMFIVFRLFAAVFGNISGLISYVIGSELTPPDYQEVSGTTNSILVVVGVVLVAGIGYMIPDWRMFQLSLSLAVLPFLFLFILLVPESPRWLVWQGREKEAGEVLSRLARYNKYGARSQDDTDNAQKFIQDKTDSSEESGQSGTQGTYKDLFIHPVTRRYVCIFSFLWTTITFTIYAIGYNMDMLFGDIYVNICVMASFDVIGLFIVPVFARKFGRKPTLIGLLCIIILTGGMAICGILLEVAGMIVTVCALICRTSANAADNMLFIISMELFPTSIRNLAMSLGGSCGYVAAILSPVVAVTLVQVWAPIPYLTYTCMALLSLLLVCVWLPETKAAHVPDNVDQLEDTKPEVSLSRLRESGDTKKNMEI